MAIKWPQSRRKAVERILDKYDRKSRKCEQAAKEILPHAKRQDGNACKWKIRPKSGLNFRCLAPKVSVGPDPWVHHVLVETESHGVDALTTADGTPIEEYASTHFDAYEFIEWIRIP